MNKKSSVFVLLNPKNTPWLPYVFAVLIIALAAGLRVWPLGALELRIPWVTFYPAVMAAALYGGFYSGMLATMLSVLVVFFWSPTDLPFIDDPGDWLGVAVFSVNGTLISLMSGMMHRAKKQAETANQAKSVFLANMSHELRSPLNAILGFANLLRKSADIKPEQMEKLNIIANSGENLLGLINNVLDISKIEAGHMIKENSDIHLLQFLHDLEQLMSVKVIEKDLNFSMELAAELPHSITIDSVKLRQVLINLFSNAIKFTDKGQIILRVTVLDGDFSRSSLWLRFEVKDTGVGISEADQQRIFTPFEQANDNNREQPTAENGTGLGLAISKQFIELMGGSIGVSSGSGTGSLFFFELPVSLPETVKEKTDMMHYEHISGIDNAQGPYRLLIVEDRMENRLLLRSLLEPLGFELHEAHNGQEAVQQFNDWQPHLIWMDIRMPVMNGLQATQIIKQSEKRVETKIIALTAHALEDERLEILDAGCDDFIRKPYRDSEIYNALAKHLGVRFLYDDKKSEKEPVKETPLNQEQLMALPAELLQELREAVILLNNDLCLNVIGVISDDNHELADVLRTMIENLQYKKLLLILDSIKGKNADVH